MATTEQFQSKYRRENRTSGTKERRRVFEADGSERESRASSGVSVSVGGTSRYSRSSNDRTESPSSLTSKMNRVNLKDNEKEGSDQEEDKATPKAEVNNEEEPTEDTQRKSYKKERVGARANSAPKRKAKKDLRQKRRSTGVVIMPGNQVVATDEEQRQVQENTARNMEGANNADPDSSKNANDDETTKKVEHYEIAIEEFKDELAKAKLEIESLRKDNLRLKDENSALMRVVGSLSYSK